MNRHVLLCTLITLLWPFNASAQSRPLQATLETPALEVGGSFGDFFWPGDDTAVSARIAVNHRRSLATEIALLRQDASPFRRGAPSDRALVITARLIEPASYRPSRMFVAAGLAIGEGFSQAVSPVVSVGFQNNWRIPIGLRVEAQRYLKARTPERRTRLLAGFSVALGSR